MAVIHAGLGENAQAIAFLEQAMDEGAEDLLDLRACTRLGTASARSRSSKNCCVWG